MAAPDLEVLDSLPILGPPDLSRWLEERLALLGAAAAGSVAGAGMRAVDAAAAGAGVHGPRLLPALLLCDWACYPRPQDRVEPGRLREVVEAFPAGFRAYFARFAAAGDPGWLPVGYSGWFPIAEETFRLFRAGSPRLADRRRIRPLSSLSPQGDFLYLFNYSVLPALRGTACARRLLGELGIEIGRTAIRGLCAITVSEDGARVARRFGMQPAAGGAGVFYRACDLSMPVE